MDPSPTETKEPTEAQRPTTAGATSKAALRKIKEELKCSVCLELLNDPRLLPCHHSFCLRCLQGIQQQSHWVIRCPNCTEEFGIRGHVSQLPRDFRANSLLDCLPAVRPESSNAVVSQPPVSSADTFLGRVSCPVCLNIYDEPRKLECGHTLCTPCLDFMEPMNGSIIHCPCCQGETNVSEGIRALPLDRAKVDYIEAISERAQEEDDLLEFTPPSSSPTPSNSLLPSRSVQPARIGSSQSTHSETREPVRQRAEVRVRNPESQTSGRNPSSTNSTPRRHPRGGNSDNQSTPRVETRSDNAVNQTRARGQGRAGNAGSQSTPRRHPGPRNPDTQSAPGREARPDNQSTPRRQPGSENDSSQSTPRRQPSSGNNNNQLTSTSGTDNNQSTSRTQGRTGGNNDQSTSRRCRWWRNRNGARRQNRRNNPENQSDSTPHQEDNNLGNQSSREERQSASRDQGLENPGADSTSNSYQWSDISGSRSAPIDIFRALDLDGQMASAFRPDTPDTPIRRNYRSEAIDGASSFDRYHMESESIESPLPSRTFWQMPSMRTSFQPHHETPLSRFIENGYQRPNNEMSSDSDSDDADTPVPSESPIRAPVEYSFGPSLRTRCPGHRNSLARLMAGIMAHQRLNDYRSRFLGQSFQDEQSPRLSSERPLYENPNFGSFWRR